MSIRAVRTRGPAKEIFLHILALAGTISLVWVTGQNPRVLVYALAFSLLYRFVAVTLLSRAAKGSSRGEWVVLLSREPAARERSRSYRDQRSGRKAGPAAYISGMLGVFMMLAVVFEMTSASGIAHPAELLPDLGWGSVIGLVYLLDDIFSRQITIAVGEPVPVNLGYNVSGLNFLIAAIFLSAFSFTLVMVIMSIVSPGISYARIAIFEGSVFLVLVIIRCAYDIRETLLDARGSIRRSHGDIAAGRQARKSA